ncbi:hypothetical protein ACKKBF_B20830 [Auxenochlorella protothecoides x Auxenochlorella symbiontica]
MWFTTRHPRPCPAVWATQVTRSEHRAARPGSRRLARLLRQPVPDRATAPEEDWEQRPAEPSTPLSLENGTVASPASLADAKERRSLRPSAGSIPQETQDSAEDRRSMLFRHDRERNKWWPQLAYHGRGLGQAWWMLHVRPNKVKQLCDYLGMRLRALPPTPGMAVDEDGLRLVEFWVPRKTVRAWNPRTGKRGTRTLAWAEGLQILVRLDLDEEAVTAITRTTKITGFVHNERVDGFEFPKPAPAEEMEAIAQWEREREPLDEAAVRDMLGMPEAPPVPEERQRPAVAAAPLRNELPESRHPGAVEEPETSEWFGGE